MYLFISCGAIVVSSTQNCIDCLKRVISSREVVRYRYDQRHKNDCLCALFDASMCIWSWNVICKHLRFLFQNCLGCNNFLRAYCVRMCCHKTLSLSLCVLFCTTLIDYFGGRNATLALYEMYLVYGECFEHTTAMWFDKTNMVVACVWCLYGKKPLAHAVTELLISETDVLKLTPHFAIAILVCTLRHPYLSHAVTATCVERGH